MSSLEIDSNPLGVTAPGGVSRILVIDRRAAELPVSFALMATRAADKVAIRVTGGCGGMEAVDKAEMIGYFRSALLGFAGVIWSGGTRNVTSDGKLDPMVTDVPAFVALDNPTCVALATTPRTGVLQLRGDSRFQLDDDGTIPNPGVAAMLIVQEGADGDLGWDGDLDAYFRLMRQWRDAGGFAVGIVAWNGGGVTKKEIDRSLALGWPTILVRGSGRAADEYAARVDSGELKSSAAIVVDRADPNTLRSALAKLGFLPAAA